MLVKMIELLGGGDNKDEGALVLEDPSVDEMNVSLAPGNNLRIKSEEQKENEKSVKESVFLTAVDEDEADDGLAPGDPSELVPARSFIKKSAARQYESAIRAEAEKKRASKLEELSEGPGAAKGSKAARKKAQDEWLKEAGKPINNLHPPTHVEGEGLCARSSGAAHPGLPQVRLSKVFVWFVVIARAPGRREAWGLPFRRASPSCRYVAAGRSAWTPVVILVMMGPAAARRAAPPHKHTKIRESPGLRTAPRRPEHHLQSRPRGSLKSDGRNLASEGEAAFAAGGAAAAPRSKARRAALSPYPSRTMASPAPRAAAGAAQAPGPVHPHLLPPGTIVALPDGQVAVLQQPRPGLAPPGFVPLPVPPPTRARRRGRRAVGLPPERRRAGSRPSCASSTSSPTGPGRSCPGRAAATSCASRTRAPSRPRSAPSTSGTATGRPSRA